MTTSWTKAVEQTADVLGEMLVEMATEAVNYSYEYIADAALESGLRTLLGDEPDGKRVDLAARAIYQKLHDSKQPNWDEMKAIEQTFWRDIARAAIGASDAALKREPAVQ
jgi:hypothetical protein